MGSGTRDWGLRAERTIRFIEAHIPLCWDYWHIQDELENEIDMDAAHQVFFQQVDWQSIVDGYTD